MIGNERKENTVTKLDIYCLYRPQVLISFKVPDSYARRDLYVDYVFHLWVLMQSCDVVN